MKKEKLKKPRKRKMMLVLPLLIIPFLTMAFWALGGGGTEVSSKGTSSGLNLQLPNAQLKDEKGESKLSYYEQAEKDSLKWKEGMENDPFFSQSPADSIRTSQFNYHPYPMQAGEYKDLNEQKVYKKLQELNRQLQNPAAYNPLDQKLNSQTSFESNSFDNGDVNGLEERMKRENESSNKDPEVEQLNRMMDRILDIQHPERVKQRTNENAITRKEKFLPVKTNGSPYSISLLDSSKKGDGQQYFYGLDETVNDGKQNAVEAVIHDSQTLTDGSIVKMRLLDAITIDGETIESGNFVFGKVSLQGERLFVDINSIRKDKSIFSVKLTVYDLDGMEGIHIPGAITRDVAKGAADHSLQGIEMNPIDPSLRMQAAAAGISAAKSLLSKKAKLVKVTVKAGYKLLLKQKDQ